MNGPTYREVEAALTALGPLAVTHNRLKTYMLDLNLVWVLPAHMLPGVTELWGIPVSHADVIEPILGHVAAAPSVASPHLVGPDQ